MHLPDATLKNIALSESGDNRIVLQWTHAHKQTHKLSLLYKNQRFWGSLTMWMIVMESELKSLHCTFPVILSTSLVGG